MTTLTRQRLVDELDAQIRAGATGFYIQSNEEERLDEVLAEVCQLRSLQPLEWNRGYGWSRFTTKLPLRDEGERAFDLGAALEGILDDGVDGRLIVVKHAQLGLAGNGVAIARLKLLLGRLGQHHAGRAAVVLVSERFDVPAELDARLMVYGLALPRGAEIESFIGSRYSVAPALLQRLAVACGGLSQAEIRHALSLADTESTGRLDEGALAVVLKQKEQVIAKGGVLEMVHAELKVDEIGGLRNLKEWLERRAKVMSRLPEAASFGVQPPKGVLIAGMPGCGKSLTAKVTASLFGLPLLRLDIGSLLGKYVGESEHNMRRALQTAEAISPCVLWIDELEKAFVGMGAANASEVTSRLLGYFLTWMQEKSGAVFTIATANDITALPPELLRKGRFDEIFYVGFPDTAERVDILRIHLRRRHQNPDDFDLDDLAERCRGYTGADMENAINEAMVTAFVNGAPLGADHLVAAIEHTSPLRETLRDKVGEYEAAFEKLKLTPASHHEGLSIAQMIRQADDKNPVNRLEVARSREVPEEVLARLATDADKEVRMAVFEHPRCPESVLAERISAGAGHGEDAELFALACLHKRAPINLLERQLVAGSIDDSLLYRLLRVTPQPQPLLRAAGYRGRGSQPFEHIENHWPYRGRKGTIMESVAFNTSVSEDLQWFLSSQHASIEARRTLAKNRGRTSDATRRLSQDPEATVRVALAHASLPVEIQNRLAEDAWIEVRKALAGNRWLDPDVQRKLASDANQGVRLALIEAGHADAMVALVDDPDDKVFDALTRHDSLPEAVYWKVADCVNPARRLYFVEHLRDGYGMPAGVLDRLIQDAHAPVRRVACRRFERHLDDAQRARLLYDTELGDDVRLTLVDPFVSEQLIWALLDSESPKLRAVGYQALEHSGELGEYFYKSLPSLVNWQNGVVPRELLEDYQIFEIGIQTLLADHDDPKIRERLAARDVDEAIRTRLQEDLIDTVRAAAAAGPSLSEMLSLTQKSMSRVLGRMS